MRRRCSWTAIALVTLCVGTNHPAFAAGPTGTDAASLAKEAKALLVRGQTEAACKLYAASVLLDAKSSVALELAGCREKQGKPALAYRALELAATSALREKVGFVEKSARAKQKALEKSVALLTVTARDGVTLSLDGELVDPAELASAMAVDPGEHRLTGSTDGKQPWERTLKLQAGQRETVAVPALDDVPKPVAVAVAPASPPGPELETDGTDAPPSDARLVVEVGFLGGFAHGAIASSTTSTLSGLPYSIASTSGGALVAACSDTTTIPGAGDCVGDFHAHTGGLLGAQAFVGWSLGPRVHLGGRAFGGTVTPGGFVLAGGPAVSLRAFGPLWLGLGGVIGFERQQAVLLSARGSVPAGAQAAAGGAEVDVPLGSKLGAVLDIDSGVIGGGTLEVAVSLLGLSQDGVVRGKPPGAALSGSLLVGVWPSVMVGSRGVVVTAPAGVSFRFH